MGGTLGGVRVGGVGTSLKGGFVGRLLGCWVEVFGVLALGVQSSEL